MAFSAWVVIGFMNWAGERNSIHTFIIRLILRAYEMMMMCAATAITSHDKLPCIYRFYAVKKKIFFMDKGKLANLLIWVI